MEVFDVYFDVKLEISQPITASRDFRGYKMKIKKHGRQHSILQTPFFCFYTCILLKTPGNYTSKTNINKTPAKEKPTYYRPQ